MSWNGQDRRALQAAAKRADEQKWSRRREDALREQLEAIKKASTGCAWDIGMAFKGAPPANVMALHNAIWPEGMPADVTAQAVGNRPAMESDAAVIARLTAERDDLTFHTKCLLNCMDLAGWSGDVVAEKARAALASIKQEAAS